MILISSKHVRKQQYPQQYNINQKNQMLKRLKINFASSQAQKFLQKYQINKTHELIPLKALSEIKTMIKNPKFKRQLIDALKKRLNSTDNVLKLKSLIIVHSCVRYSFDEEFCDIIMSQQSPENFERLKTQQNDRKSLKMKVLQEVQIKNYMSTNIIGFYLIYLKKICANQESYLFVRDYSTKKMIKNIELISHGFKIINLMNYILESQETFNKMGRYYIDHHEIFNMFIILLYDLDYFNLYIKKTVKKMVTFKEEKKKSLQDFSEIQINTEEAEETKHIFLYINESQKTSDRLYEFYYNRYYYKKARNLITFPTFLTVQNKQYNRIKSETKRVDKRLVEMVKMSKYHQKQSTSSTKVSHTEQNINKTFSFNKFNTQGKISNFQDEFSPYANITMDLSYKNQEMFLQ